MQVGVGVDPARDHEAAGRVVHLLAGHRGQRRPHLGDPTVGADADVRDALAVDVDQGAARYEHVNNSSAQVDKLLKAVVSRTS